MAKGSKIKPFNQLAQSFAAKSAAVSPARGAATGFHVDFSKIPPPSRVYYAQECWTELDRGIVGIFFAQKRRNEETLRSLVCIRISPLYVVHWLRSVDQIQSPTILEIAKVSGATPENLTPYPNEAEQTFEISANVVKTGMSGLDVTLDFIKFTPFAISEARSTHQAIGEPQIRVDLRSSLFLGLLDNLSQMAKSFPKEAFLGSDD